MIKAKTRAEARDLARSLRRTFAGTDWRVVIYPAIFHGDLYRVVVE